MGTLADKLVYTKNAKLAIKNSITLKGVPVLDTDPLNLYSKKIDSISAGLEYNSLFRYAYLHKTSPNSSSTIEKLFCTITDNPNEVIITPKKTCIMQVEIICVATSIEDVGLTGNYELIEELINEYTPGSATAKISAGIRITPANPLTVRLACTSSTSYSIIIHVWEATDEII